jgi:hypothetical protein
MSTCPQGHKGNFFCIFSKEGREKRRWGKERKKIDPLTQEYYILAEKKGRGDQCINHPKILKWNFLPI